MTCKRLVFLAQLLAAALLLLITGSARADDLPIPALTGRVVDQANILSSSEESRLTSRLSDLETKTSVQLVVVTLASLQDRPIEDWGLTLGRAWGIGQKGKDNGALLMVAPNDRELRIEVGYGLEGTLPDATADSIIRNVIVPRFRAGDMAGGISDGVNAIITVLSGGSGEEFMPSPRERVSQTLSEWIPVLFVGVFIIMVIAAQLRDRRRRRRGRYYRNSTGGWLYLDDYDRGWRGGRIGGGGFRGGGFGGGGGGFGGGGASGRW
jgi:uncharacterized protein